MFGFETNQKQINKLEKAVLSLDEAVKGGGWHTGLQYDVRHLTTWVSNMQKEINRLHSIIKESGIIEYVDISDINFDKDKEAYQINKVKTK
jgi:peroxiredoxin